MRFEIDGDALIITEVNMRRIPWKKIDAACAFAAKRLQAKLPSPYSGNNDTRTIRAAWVDGLPEEKADLAEDVVDELNERFG